MPIHLTQAPRAYRENTMSEIAGDVTKSVMDVITDQERRDALAIEAMLKKQGLDQEQAHNLALEKIQQDRIALEDARYNDKTQYERGQEKSRQDAFNKTLLGLGQGQTPEPIMPIQEQGEYRGKNQLALDAMLPGVGKEPQAPMIMQEQQNTAPVTETPEPSYAEKLAQLSMSAGKNNLNPEDLVRIKAMIPGDPKEDDWQAKLLARHNYAMEEIGARGKTAERIAGIRARNKAAGKAEYTLETPEDVDSALAAIKENETLAENAKGGYGEPSVPGAGVYSKVASGLREAVRQYYIKHPDQK